MKTTYRKNLTKFVLFIVFFTFAISAVWLISRSNKEENLNTTPETQALSDNNSAQKPASDQLNESVYDASNMDAFAGRDPEDGNKSIDVAVEEIPPAAEETQPAAEETQPAAIEEIKFISGPKPLDLEPHEPCPESYFEFSRNDPVVGPYYGEGWRMQVIEFKGNTAVIDFGNTSDKPLVISNDNVYYVLFGYGGDNISGSNVIGGPVTIAPNEIKRVTIKAKHKDAVSLYINIYGWNHFMDDHSAKQSITDAKPFIAEMDDVERRFYPLDAELLSVKALDTVSGNGKFKYMAENISLIANDQIGSMKKPSQPLGSLALVKVKIANTSEETMEITRIRQNYINTSNKEGGSILIDDNILDALGNNALPTVIQPGEIVEGYLPVSYMGNEYIHALAFDSNLGIFTIGDIESFPLGE